MSVTPFDSKIQPDLFFLPLGGSGEIGMNLNLYCYDDQWLMVDLGITFVDQLGIEVVMPDPSYIVERRNKLRGLVLTHAHEDHIGAVPYLWEQLRCPIYATPFTSTLVRQKLKDAGLLDQAKIYDVKIGSHLSLQPFEVQFLPITHSIPESNALVIHTPVGTVVHTGDWKLDPEPLISDAVDETLFKAVGDKGILALVCDSTNAFLEGNAGSEMIVRQKLTDLVSRQKRGRVIIACFASNVARLESCAIAACQAGRQPILLGRSMLRMEQAARANGYLKNLPAFLRDDEVKSLKPEEMLIICTGSQGESRSALARMTARDHPRLKLSEGDTVLFSSRIIPGNEEAIRNMQEALIEQGVEVIDAKQVEHIHVSGHPGREDLKKMYEWIRPQILVPVHGRIAHMREQAKLGHSCGIPHTIVPRNGTLIKLSSQGPERVEVVKNGRLALDGSKVVPLFSAQMQDRTHLMSSGVLFVTIAFDKRGRLQEEPHLTQLGVFEEKVEKAMLEDLQTLIAEAITNTPQEVWSDDSAIKEIVRVACRRYIYEQRTKKPIIVAHLIR